MKTVKDYVILLLFLIGLSSCHNRSPKRILHTTLKKIEKIETVEQVLVTDYYDSTNYFIKTDTSIYYFDFGQPGIVRGAKYHCPGDYFSSERSAGSYCFDTAKIMDAGSGRKVYKGTEMFYFPVFGSYDAVKRFLPGILADTSVQLTRLKDTVLDNRGDHYHINFLLLNKNIQPGGEIARVSYAGDQLHFSYDLLINKESGLPSEIIHKYIYLNKIQNGWKARTLKYDFNPKKPYKTWNLSLNPLNYISYSEEDQRKDKKERLHAQIINQQAPDWELPDLDGNFHSLDDFRDKLLLLEFWYVGCSDCLKSIPFLNQVKNQYDPKKLDVVGINTIYHQRDQLKKYIRESGIEFRVLRNGGQTAKQYKMQDAPLILLIKNGVIIYAEEGFNEEIGEELVTLIDKNV